MNAAVLLSVLSVPVGAAPAAAPGPRVDVRSVLLVQTREVARDGELYRTSPAREALQLEARNLPFGASGEGSVVLSLWGQVDPGDPEEVRGDGRSAAGDVDLGFADARLLDGRLLVRAGRQLATGGLARTTHLDGVRIVAEPWRGAGGSLWGGVPVEPRFGAGRGDAAAGARLYYRPSWETEIGLSTEHALDQGRRARSDVGADLRATLLDQVFVSGFGAFSLLEERLVEASGSLAWEPARAFLIEVAADRTAPDLFLSRASILSVFTTERRDEAGLGATFRPWRFLRIRGDWREIRQAGNPGRRISGRATVDLLRGRAAIGAEAERLDLEPCEGCPDDGFTRARAYARAGLWRELVLTLDADHTWLDDPRNGFDRALVAAATLRAPLGGGFGLLGGVVAGESPWLERRFEVLGRLTYDLSLSAPASKGDSP